MEKRRVQQLVAGVLAAALVWGAGGAEAACRLNAPTALRAKAAAAGSVRVIVELKTDFRPEGSLGKAQAFMQRNGITALRGQILARLGAGVASASVKAFETIPYFAAQVDQNGLEALLNDAGVASVQEDKLSRPHLAQSVPLIHAPEAWAAGYSGSGWAVAVLDTGVAKDHPFLAGKVVSEACYSTTNAGEPCQSVCPGGASESTAAGAAVPPVGGGYGEDFYHGTHVAGIVAGHDASSSGVARDGNIIAVQVFSYFPNEDPGDRALTWDSDQIRGMERIYALRNTYKIAAVNMSLGGGKFTAPCDTDARKAIIDNLRSVGIATVISSGNNGYTDATGAPGCISTAVTVGATTKSDVVATYSNSASFVDVLAPGSSINSSIPGGGFASWNGTSMAAPHVAGAFAVIRTAYPDLTVDQIEDALKQTGVAVSDSPRAGSPLAITKPRIRVKETIDALALITPTPTTAPVTPTPTMAPPTGFPTVFPSGGGGGGGCNAGMAPWALLLALPLLGLIRR